MVDIIAYLNSLPSIIVMPLLVVFSHLIGYGIAYGIYVLLLITCYLLEELQNL